MAKALPRPVDVLVSNFHALVNSDTCTGCGTCVERCQMDAVSCINETAVITMDRCIGCGVCVPTCPSGSLSLVKKENETVPPKDMEALYESIMAYKK